MAAGHIQRRGKHSYRLAIYLGKDQVTGKKKYYYETIRGKKNAEKRLREILTAIDKGAWVEPTKLTLREYIEDRWLPHVNARKQQSTYDMYESICRVHIVPNLGHIPLQNLNAMMLDDFYNERLQAPRADGQEGTLSENTIKHIHDIIRIALNQAVKWGILVRNVAEAATPPEVPKQRPAAWTPEQAAKFLESVKNDRYYAAYLLAIQAGLRRGEILGLRWQDINFVERYVTIKQTLVKTSKGNVLKDPKTKDSQNATALSEATVDALRARMFAQAREKQDWEEKCGPGTWKNPANLVFTREDGSPIKPDSFSRQFKKRLGKGGIPRIRFHDQRHTAATIMIDAGTDIKVVSNQLRHADIGTTSDFYIGPIPEAQRRAADAMDRILGLSNDSNRGLPKDCQNEVQ